MAGVTLEALRAEALPFLSSLERREEWAQLQTAKAVKTLLQPACPAGAVEGLCELLTPPLFEDVALERATSGVCGYPCCRKPPARDGEKTSKHLLFLAQGRDSIPALSQENYCSSDCRLANRYIYRQLSPVHLAARLSDGLVYSVQLLEHALLDLQAQEQQQQQQQQQGQERVSNKSLAPVAAVPKSAGAAAAPSFSASSLVKTVLETEARSPSASSPFVSVAASSTAAAAIEGFVSTSAAADMMEGALALKKQGTAAGGAALSDDTAGAAAAAAGAGAATSAGPEELLSLQPNTRTMQMKEQSHSLLAAGWAAMGRKQRGGGALSRSTAFSSSSSSSSKRRPQEQDPTLGGYSLQEALAGKSTLAGMRRFFAAGGGGTGTGRESHNEAGGAAAGAAGGSADLLPVAAAGFGVEFIRGAGGAAGGAVSDDGEKEGPVTLLAGRDFDVEKELGQLLEEKHAPSAASAVQEEKEKKKNSSTSSSSSSLLLKPSLKALKRHHKALPAVVSAAAEKGDSSSSSSVSALAPATLGSAQLASRRMQEDSSSLPPLAQPAAASVSRGAFAALPSTSAPKPSSSESDNLWKAYSFEGDTYGEGEGEGEEQDMELQGYGEGDEGEEEAGAGAGAGEEDENEEEAAGMQLRLGFGIWLDEPVRMGYKEEEEEEGEAEEEKSHRKGGAAAPSSAERGSATAAAAPTAATAGGAASVSAYVSISSGSVQDSAQQAAPASLPAATEDTSVAAPLSSSSSSPSPSYSPSPSSSFSFSAPICVPLTHFQAFGMSDFSILSFMLNRWLSRETCCSILQGKLSSMQQLLEVEAEELLGSGFADSSSAACGEASQQRKEALEAVAAAHQDFPFPAAPPAAAADSSGQRSQPATAAVGRRAFMLANMRKALGQLLTLSLDSSAGAGTVAEPSAPAAPPSTSSSALVFKQDMVREAVPGKQSTATAAPSAAAAIPLHATIPAYPATSSLLSLAADLARQLASSSFSTSASDAAGAEAAHALTSGADASSVVAPHQAAYTLHLLLQSLDLSQPLPSFTGSQWLALTVLFLSSIIPLFSRGAAGEGSEGAACWPAAMTLSSLADLPAYKLGQELQQLTQKDPASAASATPAPLLSLSPEQLCMLQFTAVYGFSEEPPAPPPAAPTALSQSSSAAGAASQQVTAESGLKQGSSASSATRTTAAPAAPASQSSSSSSKRMFGAFDDPALVAAELQLIEHMKQKMGLGRAPGDKGHK